MGMRKHEAINTGVNLGLIITPMLDMSFQILSFFIMTYHPSALEGHIPGSLAPPDKVASKGPENVLDNLINPSVPEDMILPELQDALTIHVKVGGPNAGGPGKIYLKRKIDPNPPQTGDASAETASEAKLKWEALKRDLRAELKRLNKEGAVEKSNIKIEADGDLRQEFIMEVYDICKESGFPKIHFVPPPMDRK